MLNSSKSPIVEIKRLCIVINLLKYCKTRDVVWYGISSLKNVEG